MCATTAFLLLASCGPSAPANAASVEISPPDAGTTTPDLSGADANDAAPPSQVATPAPTDNASPSNDPLATSTAPPPSAPPQPAPAPPPAGPSSPQPTAAEIKACAARGGKIQPVCMLGGLECVIRFRDGGKKCTDKKDCTGECLFEGSSPPPSGKASGACQRTSDPCGCKIPIVAGKVQPGICVD